MTKDFAKQFIDLRLFSFAFEPFTELPFNHRKGCFNITSFMIERFELVVMKLIEIVKISPKTIFRSVIGARVITKRNKRHTTFAFDKPQILYRNSLQINKPYLPKLR